MKKNNSLIEVVNCSNSTIVENELSRINKANGLGFTVFNDRLFLSSLMRPGTVFTVFNGTEEVRKNKHIQDIADACLIMFALQNHELYTNLTSFSIKNDGVYESESLADDVLGEFVEMIGTNKAGNMYFENSEIKDIKGKLIEVESFGIFTNLTDRLSEIRENGEVGFGIFNDRLIFSEVASSVVLSNMISDSVGKLRKNSRVQNIADACLCAFACDYPDVFDAVLNGEINGDKYLSFGQDVSTVINKEDKNITNKLVK